MRLPTFLETISYPELGYFLYIWYYALMMLTVND